MDRVWNQYSKKEVDCFKKLHICIYHFLFYSTFCFFLRKIKSEKSLNRISKQMEIQRFTDKWRDMATPPKRDLGNAQSSITSNTMQLLSSHCPQFCISPSLSYILYSNWISAQDTHKHVVRVNIKQFKRTGLNKLFVRPCAKSHLLRSDRGMEEKKEERHMKRMQLSFVQRATSKRI